MSEPSKNSVTNTEAGSSSTRPDTDAIKMEMSEILEILRGLHNKHGAIVQVRAKGELVIAVVRFPGMNWSLSETVPHTLMLEEKKDA